ncbi:MAG TPA: right-handed parallel beta-helix repeat-containing protein [Solirubrobacterales bacterium]
MSRSFASRRSLTLVVPSLAAIAALLALLLGDDGSQGNAHARSPATARHAGHLSCDSTLGSLEALRSRAAEAGAGTVLCLRSGSYGELNLSARSSGNGVTVRAADPGEATLAGATLRGSHLTLADFDVEGEITIEPGSRKISVLHNRISGGYFGVEAGPTTSTYISDTTIAGNRFVGPFGEDAIRLNRYHDSGDRDPYGVLVEGNEITGVRENGNHSDCLQSVWGGDGLYFRRNYVHDNRCQGFFVNDQPAPIRRIVLADNLMLRNAAPCDPPESGCGPPLIVQIIGPIRGVEIFGNTIWTPENDSPLALREGPFGAVSLAGNAIYRGWSDWSGPWRHFGQRGDLVCRWEGTLPRLSRSSRRDCKPGFANPSSDDYRLRSGAGVDWAPGDRHYGP